MKPKERDEVMALKKQLKKFNFLCMLVVQCKILQIVNIPSQTMQYKTIDLISAHKLLQTAAEDISQLRWSFDTVLKEASTIGFCMGFAKTVFKQTNKENKKPTLMKYPKE